MTTCRKPEKPAHKPHLAVIGLNFSHEEKMGMLVDEVVNLSKWGVAPFILQGQDALGQEFFIPLEEGVEKSPEDVLLFFEDCRLVFPVTVWSLRGTGVVLN